MSLSAVATLFAAACVLLLGTVVNRSVPVLSRYAIPDPVTGGLIFALAAWGAQAGGPLLRRRLRPGRSCGAYSASPKRYPTPGSVWISRPAPPSF